MILFALLGLGAWLLWLWVKHDPERERMEAIDRGTRRAIDEGRA